MLQLSARGCTDKEIAAELGLSEGTLRTYWERLRARFGAQSRTELVAKIYQAEIDRLEQERDSFRAMLDLMPGFVWTANAAGYVDFVSEEFERYSGMARQAFIGQGCRALMPSSQLLESAGRWRQAQATQQGYEANVLFQSAESGTHRWHTIRLVPFECAEGVVTRWLGTAVAAPV